MDTKILGISDAAIEEAAALLRAGQVVAMPTETVYGLAADATNSEAVRRIFAAKGRPQDNPLIVHIDDMNRLPKVAKTRPEVYLLAAAFWPGPLTLVLPRAAGVADEVSAGLATVGVRMPAHGAARRLIAAVGAPLAAPSANRSGSPSPTTAAHVLADMEGRIPLILDGGASVVGVESTVLSLAEEHPTVLRPGFVTAREISEVLGKPVLVHPAVEAQLLPGQTAASPGMKYKHYAPRARVVILQGSFAAYRKYLAQHATEGVWALCFEGEQDELPVPALAYGKEGDDASQAAGLFSALRALDENEANTAYARSPGHSGVGLAVYNRLLRAAAFQVEQL